MRPVSVATPPNDCRYEAEGMWFNRDWDAKMWPSGWLPPPLLERLNTFLGHRFIGAWLPRQVHGRRVAVLSYENVRIPMEFGSTAGRGSLRFYGATGADETEADAVLTDAPDILIGVRTADCLPVWIRDVKGRWVGVVHAGWRGIKIGVVESALETAARLWNTNAADVMVRIGPGIRRCCYRVGEEMKADFKASMQRSSQGWVLDLVDALKRRLGGCGVAPSQISDTMECTFCCGLYSYRRQGEAAGRHVSLTGIKKKQPRRRDS